MKQSLDDKTNPLVEFLFSCRAKKRNRRKYIEWLVLDYSITQDYNSETVYIRKKREAKSKQYFNGSRAYIGLGSFIDSKYALDFLLLDETLKKRKVELRKLKIKNLLNI